MKNWISKLNAEFGPARVERVAEKIGSLFGEEGRVIGKKIDDWTKDVTIKF